jgi:hypothetical protein
MKLRNLTNVPTDRGVIMDARTDVSDTDLKLMELLANIDVNDFSPRTDGPVMDFIKNGPTQMVRRDALDPQDLQVLDTLLGGLNEKMLLNETRQDGIQGSSAIQSRNADIQKPLAKKQEQENWKPGMLKKDPETIARVNAKYGPEISASIDEKGQLSLFGKGPDPLEEKKQGFDITTRMSAIESAAPEAKEAMLRQFQGDLAEYQTKQIQGISAIAEQELGIPALREQLRQSEVLDKQHPEYHKHPYDSKETVFLRQRFTETQSRVGEYTKQKALMDPSFTRMTQVASSFMKNQERLLTRAEDRAAISQEKIDMVTSDLTDKNMDFLKTIYGDMDEKMLKEKAYAMRMNKDPNVKMLLAPDVTDTQYLTFGALGIAGAQTYVIKKQMDAGFSKEAAEKDIEDIRKLALDPIGLAKEFLKYNKGTEAEAFAATITKSGIMKGATKDQQMEQQKVNLATAIQLINAKRQEEPYKDTIQWAKDLPGVEGIFKGNQPVSLQEFLTKYVMSVPKEQRNEPYRLAKEAFGNYIKQRDKGIIGTIEIAGALRRFDSAAISSEVSPITSLYPNVTSVGAVNLMPLLTF